MTLEPVALPALYSPFPLKVHPRLAAVETATVAWMDRFELYQDQTQRERLARTGCGRLAAHMASRGTQKRLQILADFTTWAFAFDDDYCDEGPIRNRPGELADALCRMQRAIESPECVIDPADRYALALRDVRIRLEEHAGTAQAEAFVEWMRGYFVIELQKSGNASRGRRPDVSDYTAVRLYSGGGMVFVRLPGVVVGLDVPAVFGDRRVRALTEMTATITSWDTDFFSYPKERDRTGDGYNLIDAVMTQYGEGEEAAVERAVVLRDQVMHLFLRVHADVAADASPELIDYLATLTGYMRGVVEWIQYTERYTHVDGLQGACPFQPGGLADAPREELSDPPQVASIAWWWRHDPERNRPTRSE